MSEGVSGGRAHRRSVIDDVAAEVRAARREVAETSGIARESAGLIAEALPRLSEVEQGLASLRGTVAALADAQDDDDDDKEVDASAAAVGLAAEPPAPWCWPLLRVDDASGAWDQLARFVGEILCTQYRLTRAQLPDCWPVHRRAVAEFSWLRMSYRVAYVRNAPAHLAAEWHARWLPAALAGVAGEVDIDDCVPGWHRVPPHKREAIRSGRSSEPVADPRDTAAARPRRTPGADSAHTSDERSGREHWWAYLVDARDEDLARRAAGDNERSGGDV